MFLKFIGDDGSMGLRKGMVYRVKVFSRAGYILVCWDFCSKCPYTSPQAFANNWEVIP